jgi:muramoyltetrapeptide carboxypeptidase
MKKIRVIAPSRSLKMICDENISLAEKKLNKLGFEVSYSKNCLIKDEFVSSSINERIEDLHDAFLDKNVDIILSALGGYNTNQLLDYINYDLIKNNPKIIGGYSDNTVLLNAIYSQCGLVTYLSPTFHSFAMKKGLEDSIESFLKIISGEKYVLIDPKIYSSDRWYDDQCNRIFFRNDGMIVVNHGKAKGKIVGGNLCSFNLLQGTKYMPNLKNKIIFIEEDSLVGEEFPYEFDRNLQSLIHQKNFCRVKGLVVGRSQNSTKMDKEKWIKIITEKELLKNIPIIINANFGHTTPNATIPIGGNCSINTKNNSNMIKMWR